MKISIKDNLCIKCGTCVLACPSRLLVQTCKECSPAVPADEACVSCGHCAAICPTGAVSHSDFPAGRIKTIDRSLIPAPEQVVSLLRARRTIRAFLDKPVEKALIETILDAANTGPTPHNAHRVEYVVVQDRETVKKMLGTLAESYGKTIFLLKNPAALEGVPAPVRERVLSARPMLPVMEKIAGRIKAGDDILQRGTPSVLVLYAPKAPVDFWGPRIDVTIALQNASLAATSLGLGRCELGYLEIAVAANPQIQSLLGITEDRAIYGVMAVGYPKYEFGNWIQKPVAKVTWL